MIAKVGPRWTDAASLIRYVYGTGQTDDDSGTHIVAGFRTPTELEPPRRPNGRRDFRRLARLLEQPVFALGERGFARPVWHCMMRAAPEDRPLSDDEWAQIASDVMHRTGLSPVDEKYGVRWVAIRCGADRLHIVATLARVNGRKPRLWYDWYQVRDACRAAEERYGLRRTAAVGSGAVRGPSTREIRRARDRGLSEVPRLTLQRQVSAAAAAATSEDEFYALLEQAGVRIRKRSSAGDPSMVTGYAVALAGDTASDGSPVWFGGGKLGVDLTLPRLRQRWLQPRIAADDHPGSVADAIDATVRTPGVQSHHVEHEPARQATPPEQSGQRRSE